MIKEKIIDREYLEKLDKELEMIPLTFDPIFKGVFGNNIDLLKRFLNEVLELDLDVREMNVRLLNTELPKQNIREYQKRIDIYLCINNNIYIDIEINRSNFNRVKLRNYLYGSKTYSMLLESGDNISELEDKYFWQLNLNTEDKSVDYGEDIIVRYSLTKKSVYLDQDKIVLKFLEYYKKLYYTDKNELNEAGIWLAGLMSTNFVELFDIYSNILESDDLSNFIKDVIDMSLENFNIHEWEKEKLDALVYYNHYKDGVSEGFEDGFDNGFDNGFEEATVKTIKEMLKKEISLQDIADITNKSIEEIKQIKNSLE